MSSIVEKFKASESEEEMVLLSRALVAKARDQWQW